MKKEDKAKTTIKPSKFEIFGIDAESTGGEALEIMEMMAFLGDCKNDHVLHYITGITYDSQEGRCHVGLAKIVRLEDPAGINIYRKANRIFRAFAMFGNEYGVGKMV